MYFSKFSGYSHSNTSHTYASANGQIYVIGGEAADGSGNTFSTHYIFDPSVPAFNQLPTQNSPPSIYGHAVTILFNVRLLVFGATGLLSQTQSHSGCPL
jgi:N-acetylneuraminic acid mutarotase